MKSLAGKFAIIALGVALVSCAGRSFMRVTDEALVLGQTTPEQVSARLGSPFQEGVVTKNNQHIKTTSYAYASTGGDADEQGVTPARSQAFYFYDNKLVGYEFISSWKTDSTNFDSEEVSQIKKGESARSDVVRLFGNPGGKYIYPVIPNRDEEAINYLYSQVKGFKVHQKRLVVTLNKQGMVTDVEYTESGQR